MSITELSYKDRETIIEVANATVEGPFFPEDEFQTLIGLSREEFKKIVNRCSDISKPSKLCKIAINNAIINMLGYPHGCEEVWSEYISVSSSELQKVFERWKAAGEKGRP
jgi:hypothetical protein